MLLESEYLILNVHDYLDNANGKLGEDVFKQLQGEFSCSVNPDVERFFKCNAVDFAKKNQSVTYVVFHTKEMVFVGYFTLVVKPVTVSAKSFSNTQRRRIARVSELNTVTQSYNLSAYLIAQLGKNFAEGAKGFISGEDLLTLACKQIYAIRRDIGGMMVFLEADNHEKLIKFYKINGFKEIDLTVLNDRYTKEQELVTFMKLL